METATADMERERSTDEQIKDLCQANEALENEIAALKNAQEELARREQELDDFVENASIPIHWVGADGIIVRANLAELNALGYSRHEYVGHHIAEFHADPSVIEDILARLRGGETLRDYEARMVAKDGSIRHVAINSNVMWKDGEFIHTRCLTRDITTHKQVERRIAAEHAVTRILAESGTLTQAAGKLLRALCEALDWQFGELWTVDEPAQVLRCLQTWHDPSMQFPEFEAECRRRFFLPGIGLPGRIWKSGKPTWIADVVKEDNFPRAPVAAKENLHAAFGFPITWGGHVRGVIEFFSREIREPDEPLLEMVEAISSEVGQFLERLRAEEELQQQNVRLQSALVEQEVAKKALMESEEKLRQQAEELEQQLIASGRLVSLGEITASMAHEFNNPLGIVMGFTQDLMSETDPSNPHYRSLKIIDEETKRCEKIIRELLQFARPKSTDFCPIDVKQVIEKTLGLVANHLYKQQIEGITQVEENLPKIYADPQELEQVLVNLYFNAIDAMPEGGALTIGAKLSLGAPQVPQEVAITVSDTGFGISPEDLPRIFQPFFTAKKKRGLGLGLPICDRIIKNHGGRIKVESQPGQGTTFEICLPVA
jgi:two-component system, cell cycle sensor histidine kinase and response regulator CckA